jgi:hypothetical protein
MAWALPMTNSSGGSMKVPSEIGLPIRPMIPSVHTNAITTVTIGSTTARMRRKANHRMTSTQTRASGVKRSRSMRISRTAACCTREAPV